MSVPVRSLTVAVVVLLVLGAAWLLFDEPPDRTHDLPDSTAVVPLQDPPSSALGARVDGRLGPPAGRPARTLTSPGENLHTPPLPRVGPDWVSGIVMEAPVLMGDNALPWRYHLDDDVVARFDEDAVHEGVRAWDGHAGTRWASWFDGYVTDGRVVADGRSTVFLEESCEGLTNANAYLFTDGGLGLRRYGAVGTQILEADIGVCPRVESRDDLVRAIRHEMGHVVGLGHLCNAADDCWRDGMGGDDLRCRIMFWQAWACQAALGDGDLAGLRATYPTIRPLFGGDRLETVARTSFAMSPDDSRDVAVVVDTADPGIAAASAAFAGRTDAAWLAGQPDADACLAGPARAEVNRVLRRRGTLVLVGDWPSSCRQMAHDWELSLRWVDGDAETAALHLAELGRTTSGTGAVISTTDADDPTLAIAAGLAGTTGRPLLLLDDTGVAPDVVALLESDRATTVTVVGSGAELTLSALTSRGIDLERIDAPGATALSLTAATLTAGEAGGPVVLAPTDAVLDGLAAAAGAGLLDAPLLLVGPTVDPAVEAFLAAHGFAEGWAVGGPTLLPQELLGHYGTFVG